MVLSRRVASLLLLHRAREKPTLPLPFQRAVSVAKVGRHRLEPTLGKPVTGAAPSHGRLLRRVTYRFTNQRSSGQGVRHGKGHWLSSRMTSGVRRPSERNRSIASSSIVVGTPILALSRCEEYRCQTATGSRQRRWPAVDLGVEAVREHLVVDAAVEKCAVERLLVGVPAPAAPIKPLLMPEAAETAWSVHNPSRTRHHR